MISKWKINLIAFLISMTLFSVGFSSWQITNNIVQTVTGDITADSVIPAPDDVSQLVIFESIDCFEFNSIGIIHRNGNGAIIKTDKTATITAHFTLYPQSLQEYFSAYNVSALSLDATLTYSNTTEGESNELFSLCSLPENALTATSYKLTTPLDGILKSTEESSLLSIDFTFTIKDEEYTNFYNAINNDSFEFHVSASLLLYIETTT